MEQWSLIETSLVDFSFHSFMYFPHLLFCLTIEHSAGMILHSNSNLVFSMFQTLQWLWLSSAESLGRTELFVPGSFKTEDFLIDFELLFQSNRATVPLLCSIPHFLSKNSFPSVGFEPRVAHVLIHYHSDVYLPFLQWISLYSIQLIPIQSIHLQRQSESPHPEFDFVLLLFGLHRHVFLLHLLHLLRVDLQTESQRHHHLGVRLELGRHLLLEILKTNGYNIHCDCWNGIQYWYKKALNR